MQDDLKEIYILLCGRTRAVCEGRVLKECSKIQSNLEGKPAAVRQSAMTWNLST